MMFEPGIYLVDSENVKNLPGSAYSVLIDLAICGDRRDPSMIAVAFGAHWWRQQPSKDHLLRNTSATEG